MREYLLRNLTIPILEITRENELQLLKEHAARSLHIAPKDILNLAVMKESIDSRRKQAIAAVYSLKLSVDGKLNETSNLKACESPEEPARYSGHSAIKPVIVGCGPCGLFCAYALCEAGLSPVILERGEEVEKRSLSVKRYWTEGQLDPESNVQFGEGGAGTFSDGKLTTRIHDPRSSKVLDALVRFGAPQDILFKAKAHIGTDILRDVVRNMREYLKGKGCTFHFSTRMDALEVKEGALRGVRLADGTVIASEAVVLAIGHSARDTFRTLLEQGVEISQKAFSVGARIEHLQETIQTAQYGNHRHFKLEAADYQLFEHLENRTSYTFCMCPGGVVVAAASEKDTVVTNGMSFRARNGINANAAFVVSVGPEDFGSHHPLAGVAFQRELEKRAWQESRNGAAPVQRLSDFINGTPSQKPGRIKPSYTGEVYYTDLHGILPAFVTHAMTASLDVFNRKLRGFSDPDAILTAVETRTSSPVRITRGENLQSVTHPGLYPAGEGAGYAGGIMSSAVDGMRIAEQITRDFQE